MNKFFNKVSLDLNLSFDGISRISEYNFDKFELNFLRVSRLLFVSNEDPNAQTQKSAFLMAEQNFSSPFGTSIAHIISISIDFMSNGRTRKFTYIRETNSSALTSITDEERYFLIALKSVRKNNISKANCYTVMLCEGPQINKFFQLWKEQPLSQKVYKKTMMNFVARLTGLEPATPGVTGRYSNQLSYNRASHKA